MKEFKINGIILGGREILRRGCDGMGVVYFGIVVLEIIMESICVED